MPSLKLDPKSTALVLIDLQKGITSHTTAPYTGPEVIANGVRLAERFRAAGATIVLVRVNFAADGSDRLQTPTDSQFPSAPPAPDWADIVPELGPKAGDIVVTKRQWGAFYGTDLELHLRRRGIQTIVIGGISTNFGVESTARDAWERAYAMVFAEDAMAAMSADAHAFAVTNIFPRMGRVRSTGEILKSLG
ncbi:MAG: hydrolase [Gemmatimonadaceae bacterium]